jgi:cytochrome c-type biogenesis protein CcmH/NrfG
LSSPACATLLAVVLVAAAFSFIGLLGHSAAAASATAAKDGRWPRAASLAHDAARWEPFSSAPWKLLAQARYGQADLPGAAQAYRIAIRKDPSNWELWRELGYSLDGKAAEAAFAQARRLNPLNQEIPKPEG